MVIDFRKVAGMVPEGGSLTFVFQKIKDGSMVMSVNAKHKKVNKKGDLEDANGSGEGFTPMVFKGTPEELNVAMKEVEDMVTLQKEYLALPEVPTVSHLNKKKDALKNKIKDRKEKIAQATVDKAKVKDGDKGAVLAKLAEGGSLPLFATAASAIASEAPAATTTTALETATGDAEEGEEDEIGVDGEKHDDAAEQAA